MVLWTVTAQKKVKQQDAISKGIKTAQLAVWNRKYPVYARIKLITTKARVLRSALYFNKAIRDIILVIKISLKLNKKTSSFSFA